MLARILAQFLYMVTIGLVKALTQYVAGKVTRNKREEKTQEAAKEVENDKTPTDIRRDADNLP